MEECYVIKMGVSALMWPAFTKGVGIKMAVFPVTYFLNDPKPKYFCLKQECTQANLNRPTYGSVSQIVGRDPQGGRDTMLEGGLWP